MSRASIRLQCAIAAASLPLANPHNILKIAETIFQFVMEGQDVPGTDVSAAILHGIQQLQSQGHTIMTTVADLKAAQEALLAEVSANTDAINSVATFVNGLKTQITDLEAQLAAAGTDPAALQAVADGLGQVKAGLDAQTVALAAVTNTPAAPPAPAA